MLHIVISKAQRKQQTSDAETHIVDDIIANDFHTFLLKQNLFPYRYKFSPISNATQIDNCASGVSNVSDKGRY